MRSDRGATLLGFSLGVAAAAAVLRWWWVRHGGRNQEPAALLPEWCPGIDPVGSHALPDEPVGWRLCGDYQEHYPHLRSAEPEYVDDLDPIFQETFKREELEIWCPGLNPQDQELKPDHQVHWERCSASIPHRHHLRIDRRQPGSPEIKATFARPPWPAPFEVSEVDQERMAEAGRKLRQTADNILASFDGGSIGEAFRRLEDTLAAMNPATPGELDDCDRDWPHPRHAHAGGVCPGRPTSGEHGHGG